MNSSLVTVQNGAVLSGTGTITGSVLNAGMISPGHSPGTLTIGGNFTQTPSGVLSIALASPTNFSRLVVGGHASLDGTLLLRLAPGFVPQATNHFSVLTAGQGISGTFRSVTDPGGPPFRATYQNGVVDLTAGDPPKAAFIPSDGTPASTTALISDYAFFNSLGSMAGREAASSGNSVGISFDGGQFHFQGRDGHTFGIPIVGHVNLTDRVALNYDIPLQYVEIPGSSFFETGVILNFPIQVITPSQDHRWS